MNNAEILEHKVEGFINDFEGGISDKDETVSGLCGFISDLLVKVSEDTGKKECDCTELFHHLGCRLETDKGYTNPSEFPNSSKEEPKEGRRLPNDKEVDEWFTDNIDKECTASSGIYKFRGWLQERLERNEI